MKKILLLVLGFGTLLGVLAVTVHPVLAASEAAIQACQAAGGVAGTDGKCETTGIGINEIVTLALRVLQVIAGVAAVAMLIVGGLRYILSSGEASKLNSAKNTIIYACVGIVIVALAQIIIQFVLNRVDTLTPDQTVTMLLSYLS